MVLDQDLPKVSLWATCAAPQWWLWLAFRWRPYLRWVPPSHLFCVLSFWQVPLCLRHSPLNSRKARGTWRSSTCWGAGWLMDSIPYRIGEVINLFFLVISVLLMLCTIQCLLNFIHRTSSFNFLEKSTLISVSQVRNLEQSVCVFFQVWTLVWAAIGNRMQTRGILVYI